MKILSWFAALCLGLQPLSSFADSDLDSLINEVKPQTNVSLTSSPQKSSDTEKPLGAKEFKWRSSFLYNQSALQNEKALYLFSPELKISRLDALRTDQAESTITNLSFDVLRCQSLESKNTFCLFGGVSISGDYQSQNTTSFNPVAAVLWSLPSSDTFRWNLGLAYTSALGDSKVLPLIGFKYSPNSDFSVQFLIPAILKLKWLVFSEDELSFFISGAGLKSKISSEKIINTQNTAADYIQKGASVGFGYKHQLQNQSQIEAELGALINRQISISNAEATLDMTISNSSFLKLGYEF